MKLFTIKSWFVSVGFLALSQSMYAALGAELGTNPTKGAASNPWTGFYTGLDLGGIFTNAKINANQWGFTTASGTCDSSGNFSSFYPGVQVGYALQLSSRMVFAIQGDYSYNSSYNSSFGCSCPSSANAFDQFTVKNRMQGSILGRMGYAMNNQLLPFFSAGVTFADLSFSYLNEINDHFANGGTQTGYRVGAGVEWGFAELWSLSAQYYYSQYQSISMAIPTIYGLNDPAGGATMKLNTNSIQFSLNYWMNT